MMFFRKISLLLTSFLTLALLASCGVGGVVGVGGDGGNQPGSGFTGVNASPTPTIIYNSISGREGSDGPVIATKIDDTRQAHPQIGLDKADAVYIEQVEGGMTRLLAIFSSEIPTRIGPVRSARISDIELLSQYGHVAFTFSGAQSKLRPVIRAANLQDLGAEHESARIYPRDPNRRPPVDMILQGQILLEKIKSENLPVENSKNMGWNFGDPPSGGFQIASAQMFWPANTYSVHWSSDAKRWLLYQYDTPDMAEDGLHLGPTTMVIQKVSITPSIYGDKFGGNTPFSATVGTGTGFILRDGFAFAANWKRPTSESGTTWTMTDGSPINFARGQIWFALTDTAAIFTLPTVAPAGGSAK